MFHAFQEASRRRSVFTIAAVGLLMILAAELLFSSRQLSQTTDEGAHLYAGYQHWRAHDFGVNPEHPPLVKLVAAAPLLPLKLVQAHPPNPYFMAEEYLGGEEFLLANNSGRLLSLARPAAALFTLLLALLVFSAAFEMFGAAAAIISLSLFTFEPLVLAHGALVTTDMGVTVFIFATVYAFYRYLKQPTLVRLLLCGLALGLALASKISGVITLPLLVLFAAIDVIPQWNTRKAVQHVGALACIALMGYVILWAFYGFHYTARPAGLSLVPPLAMFTNTLPHPYQASIVLRLAHWHLLPEAYLYGWTKLIADDNGHPLFILGRVLPRGVWYYFPVALLIKSSLTLLTLCLLGPALCLRSLRPYRQQLLFVTAPLIVILVALMRSHLNIGVRHALPVFPFAIVLAGFAAWTLARQSRIAVYTVGTLLLLQAVSSLHTYPNYIPYGNEAFGGPDKTYRLLADSNVDWAQSLPQIRKYLAQHPGEHCWLAWSWPSPFTPGAGIPCDRLPTGIAMEIGQPQAIVPAHITGMVLVDAMDASGTLWGPHDMNPYLQFQNGKPDGLVASSILVYRGSYDVHLAAAQSHYSQVPALLMRGMGAKALEEAQTAAALAPESATIQAELGGTLLAVHRPDEAEQAFSRAMQMAKTHQPEDQSALLAPLVASLRRPPM